MAKSYNRLYCAVYGCLNSSLTHPEMTFFKLPGNTERRLEWLQLICRNDLENKPNFAAYRICEKHFNAEDIRQTSTRKLLNRNALPFLMLPGLPSTVPGASRRDKQTQTGLSVGVESCTQTKNAANESYTQTSMSLSSNSPRKGKLKAELLQSRKKIQLQVTENKTQKAAKSTYLAVAKGHFLYESEIPSSRNEIKVFCPKCNTEVSHTAEGIQEDQTKILVAKVYHYFEKEYEDLKKIYGDLDLTPLSNFRQRTALATGVSETTLLQILQEEEERNADKRREPPKKRRAARKRRRQTDCSREEGSSDDNVDDIEQPRHADETLTVVVKIEPPIHNNDEPEKSEIILPAEMKLEHSDGEIDNDEPEIFIPPLKMESSDGDTDKEQTDPISLDVKTEPRDDEMDTTNETLALNEPATTKRKGRKISRNSDDKSIQSSLSGDRRNT